MAVEDILSALEEKAEKQIREINADAERQVREIKAEVEREVARAKRARLKKLEDQLRSEANAMIYSASLEAKREITKAQEETVEKAFKLAEKRLAALHDDVAYPKVFEALLDECLELIDGEVVLMVRPDDRALAQKLMEAKERPFVISDTPLETSGGLIAISKNGEITVNNTFESRLEKASEKLKVDISKVLFTP
ncbi:MAG: V-type ATP synthase subunit E [Actinomycetota bacterium]|nr:V-type ATP synthase subunit E [Actinomycetota bacterium]